MRPGRPLLKQVPSLYLAFATLFGFFAIGSAAAWCLGRGCKAVGAVVAVLNLVVFGSLSFLVRCRRCGERVIYRRFRRGVGTPDYVGYPFDGRCSRCGAELWRCWSDSVGCEVVRQLVTLGSRVGVSPCRALQAADQRERRQGVLLRASGLRFPTLAHYSAGGPTESSEREGVMCSTVLTRPFCPMYSTTFLHKSFLSFLLLILIGCAHRFDYSAIEVKGGTGVEERLRIAQGIVTQARLARLKREIKARVPGITDKQLASLGLRWNQATLTTFQGGGSRTVVSVVVVLQDDGEFDPQPILRAAVAILEPEVNPVGTSRGFSALQLDAISHSLRARFRRPFGLAFVERRALGAIQPRALVDAVTTLAGPAT